MAPALSYAARGCAAALSGMAALAAGPQESLPAWVPSLEVKVRVGYGLKQEDMLRAGTLSVGLNLLWDLPKGRLGLELGNHYKTGDRFLGPVGEAASSLQPVDRRNSAIQMYNELKGFYGRVSYEAQAVTELNLVPRAGVMIGGAQFRHEYFGDVRSLNWDSTTPNAWRDTFTGTPTKGGLPLSPFAGVGIPVGENSLLEVQVLLLRYTALELRHVSGGGSRYVVETDIIGMPTGPLAPHNAFPQDRLEERSRMVPHLECGWTFRF